MGNCRVPSHGSFLQRLLSLRFCDSYRASRMGCPAIVCAMRDLTALCWIPYCFTRGHWSTNRVVKHTLSPGWGTGSRQGGFFLLCSCFFPHLWRSSENMKATLPFPPSLRNKIRACPSILFEKHLSSINSFIRIRGEAESKWSLLADKKKMHSISQSPRPLGWEFHAYLTCFPSRQRYSISTHFLFSFKWLKCTVREPIYFLIVSEYFGIFILTSRILIH